MEIITIVVILSSQISELKELLRTKTDKTACINWLTDVQGYEGSLLKVTSKNGKTASPVGFVTFSSRASAEAAKQDLQVRCWFVMTSTSSTSTLTHTQREDDLPLDNIRVPRNTCTSPPQPLRLGSQLVSFLLSYSRRKHSSNSAQSRTEEIFFPSKFDALKIWRM